MKHLFLFESFSSTEYFWPDAKFWIEDLYPEEICYLAAYNDIMEWDIKHSYSKKDIKPFFEINTDWVKTYDLEADSWDENEGEVQFEIYYEIPSLKNEEKGSCSISFEVRGSGGFTPYSSGSYYDPPEGGESILDDIEVSDVYYLDSIEDLDVYLDKNTYEYKSNIITKKDLFGILEYAASLRIEYSDEKMGLVKPQVPQALIDKCESIRSKYPDIVKGSSILSRYSK